MRKVVDRHTVAHLWANQHQQEARTPTDNLYFYGKTIYSYGSHFPIACHVENKKGENAILFTTNTYSSTTAQHISIVRGAIASWRKVIYCNNPKSLTGKDNFEAFEDKILEISRLLEKAKKPEKYVDQIKSINNQINIYSEFTSFKIPNSLKKLMAIVDKNSLHEILLKRHKKIEADRKKAIKKANLERQIEIKKYTEETLPKWRNFELPYLYGKVLEVDYLRYNEEKQEIETSQRVNIPFEVAKKFYHTIIGVINKTVNQPEKFLNFQINKINKEFIEIGCHKIQMSEILTIANQLKF